MEHTYRCEMSLACTYSLRCPRLAAQCAVRAWFAALQMGNPELAWNANELLGIIQRGL